MRSRLMLRKIANGGSFVVPQRYKKLESSFRRLRMALCLI